VLAAAARLGEVGSPKDATGELMDHGYGDAIARYEGPASARRQRRSRPTHASVRVRPAGS